MDEYLCLTLFAAPAESEPAFKARLTAFWTFLLRNRPDDYAKVYAEAAAFGTTSGRVSRQYMVELDAIDRLLEDVTANSLEYLPPDRDDTYSRYEAASPEWFQIPH